MTSSIDLTAEQRDAIVAEALSAGFFERTVDGELPEDSALHDAAVELVRQATLSHRAGNRNPGVLSILNIAEVDPSQESSPKGNETMSVETDLQQQSNEAIQKFYDTLSNYPENDEVQANLAVIQAEMQRRGMTVSGDQPATNGHAATIDADELEEAQRDPKVKEFLAEADEYVTGLDDVERKSLEDRLSFSVMRHHGLDPSEIPSLSIQQLRWIVEHPGGDTSEPQPQQETTVQEPAPGDTIETTRMVVDRPPERPAVESPSPNVATSSVPVSDISAEREELEGQVTGPMLKAFGRGRVDVPSIGDNELRFMIEHADGRVTQEQLFAARALDEGGPDVAPAEEPEVPTIAEQRREEKTTYTEPVEEPVTEVPPASVTATVRHPDASFDPADAEAVQVGTAEPVQTTVAPPAPPRQNLLKDLPANPAAEIIERERFPVPPEIDEDPPRLPFDMSKCSDAEVASLHARFHACHSRANYVVGLWEGELRDLVRLRKGVEVQVANETPTKDGRTRLTDAQRDAMIAAHPSVIEYREQEHAIESVLRQLAALRDGYSRDVSTCSRQLSARKEEQAGAR